MRVSSRRSRTRWLRLGLFVLVFGTVLGGIMVQSTPRALIATALQALVPAQQPQRAVQHAPAGPATTVAGRLPLAFAPYVGQSDPLVRFQAQAWGGTLFFTPNEVVVAVATPNPNAPSTGPNLRPPAGAPLPDVAPTLPPTVVRIQFQGANAAPQVTAADPLPGVNNYLRGSDPSHWYTNVPTSASIDYHELFPGVALRYSGIGSRLKSTYMLAAGADPRRIRWQYVGVSNVQLDPTGQLVALLPALTTTGLPNPSTTAVRSLTESPPVAWQDINGQRTSVSVQYTVGSDGVVGFAVGTYDPAYALTIDPTAQYTAAVGGSATDAAESIAVDGVGNTYITGNTYSADFPTSNAAQASNHGSTDAFIVSINADGTAMRSSTYLGGSGNDAGHGIALDGNGNMYVTGATRSTDFPTRNPVQATNASDVDPYSHQPRNDVFVASLNATGTTLRYATYLGGNSPDVGYGIAVDRATGAAYVTGNTGYGYGTGGTQYSTFPLQSTTNGTGVHAFVAAFSPTGTLPYTKYLAEHYSVGYGIAVDGKGGLYITGSTTSGSLVTQNAVQTANAGASDVFVMVLNAGDGTVRSSTYLGGSGDDSGSGIVVDRSGNIYVAGSTASSSFPTYPAGTVVQGTSGGGTDAFVVSLVPSGNAFRFSTYIGGSGSDNAQGIAVDSLGTSYVTGTTDSPNFPLQTPAQGGNAGGQDAFVTRINASGDALVYSSYLGGSAADYGYAIAADDTDKAYVTGYTTSSSFAANSALQPASGGGTDAFVVKLDTMNRAPVPTFDPSADAYPAPRTPVPTAPSQANLPPPPSAPTVPSVPTVVAAYPPPVQAPTAAATVDSGLLPPLATAVRITPVVQGPVLRDVWPAAPAGVPATGNVLYLDRTVDAAGEPHFTFWQANAANPSQRQQLFAIPQAHIFPTDTAYGQLSPDGNWIAYQLGSQGYTLYVVRRDGSDERLVATHTGGPNAQGAAPLFWSPDSTRLLFPDNCVNPSVQGYPEGASVYDVRTNAPPQRIACLDRVRPIGWFDATHVLTFVRGANPQVVQLVKVDLATDVRQVVTEATFDSLSALAPDRRHILLFSTHQTSVVDVASGVATPLRATPSLEQAVWSADGQALLGVPSSGREGAYVTPLDPTIPVTAITFGTPYTASSNFSVRSIAPDGNYLVVCESFGQFAGPDGARTVRTLMYDVAHNQWQPLTQTSSCTPIVGWSAR